LRERLHIRSADIDELLTIAAQVADALAAPRTRDCASRSETRKRHAHKDGGAKLLDFGIAAHTRLTQT
jgi:hypothetical protein